MPDPDPASALFAQLAAFLGIGGVAGTALAKSVLGQSGIRAEIDQLKTDSKAHGEALAKITPQLAVLVDRSREARRDRKALMRKLDVQPEPCDEDDADE